jgi:hypothetical protein
VLLTLALAGSDPRLLRHLYDGPNQPCKMRPIVKFILVVLEAVHVAYRKLNQAALMLRDFDAEEQESQKHV